MRTGARGVEDAGAEVSGCEYDAWGLNGQWAPGALADGDYVGTQRYGGFGSRGRNAVGVFCR